MVTSALAATTGQPAVFPPAPVPSTGGWIRHMSAVVVVLLAARACAADAPRAPASPPPPMSASLVLYRHEAAGQVRVRVSNTGANDLLVRRLRVQWSGLEDVAPTEQDYPIRPGQLVALPVRYGAARCDVAATAPPDQGSLVATVRVGDRQEQEIMVPLDGSVEVLAALFIGDCRPRALARLLDVTFAPSWRSARRLGEPALLGAVVVRRRGGSERVAVTAVDGNVLLDLDAVTPSRRPLLALGPDEPSGSLPVAVTSSGRCDKHALAEIAWFYRFDVFLSLDGAPREHVTRQPRRRRAGPSAGNTQGGLRQPLSPHPPLMAGAPGGGPRVANRSRTCA